MAHCATQFFERDIFSSNRLDNIWTSNEHVAGLAHHENKVGHRRRIDGATRTRPEHDANLWNHT